MANTNEGRAGALKRHCYFIPSEAFIEGHGFRVSVIFEGESGHSPTGTWPYTGAPGETMPWFWGDDYETAKGVAAKANADLGLSPRDVLDIVNSSIRAELKDGTRKRGRGRQ
jgi:hypothetical protein